MTKIKTLVLLLIITTLVTGCSSKKVNKEYVREDLNTYGKVSWQQKTEYKVETKGTVYKVSDYDSVSSAIEDAISKGGGTVYFPSRTYTINKSIILNVPDGVELILSGDPNGSSILKSDKNIDGAIIEIQSKGVKISHLAFQSYSSDKTALLVKGEGTVIYKCSFQGQNARNTESTVIVAASNTTVSSCNFSNIHKEAYTLRITKYPGIEAKNINIVDFFLNGEFNGFVIDSEDNSDAPQNVLITRGVFLNYSKEQLTIKTVKDCIVENNMLDQGALYCIKLAPENTGIDGLTISENYIAAAYGLGNTLNATSIYCETTQKGTAKNIVIKNNMIAYTMIGLHITSKDFSNFVIKDNVFQNEINTCLIVDSANNLLIEKNTFKPDAGAEKLKIIEKDSATIIRNNF